MEDYSSCENYTLSNDSFESNYFNVYPNPVKITTTVSSYNNIDKIKVFDLFGKQVYEASPKQKSATVNMSTLPTGIYVMIIKAEKKQTIMKLIKQ
jgi:hypothetical protein